MRKADTKEYVTQALFSLLEKKEMKDITVCELVEKAGICRATFYRNYLDMYQVIDEQMMQIAQETTSMSLTLKITPPALTFMYSANQPFRFL